MDMRGFQAHNTGCRYELAKLAQAPRTLRVVVLVDDRTDRGAAQEAVVSGKRERFTWIEVSHFDARKRDEVLAHLFARWSRPVIECGGIDTIAFLQPKLFHMQT